MKKMDEMEKNIRLRAESWGFRAAVLAMMIWSLFNILQSRIYGVQFSPFPSFVLCFMVFVQSCSQIFIKQKMIAGDEEYKEPNKFLRTILFSMVIVVLVMSIMVHIIIR